MPGGDHPVYSMCLSGALITLTGVPTDERVSPFVLTYTAADSL